MSMSLIVFGILVIIVIWFIAIYNGLIRARNTTREAWSGIDVQLKKRYDLIPNLVETVKGYSKHEQQLFQTVTEMRSRCMSAQDVKEKGQLESSLTQGIRSLFAVAENYPDLKASQNFLSLQKDLMTVESDLEMARRYYNGAARNLNNLVESFPSLLVANMGGFKTAEYFEIETPSERETPKVQF
jgi:LemA protein